MHIIARTVAIALALPALQAGAQNHFIGVKGGYSQAGTTNSTSGYHNQRTVSGSSAGLTYDYNLGKHVSIGADLLYQQRGFALDYLFADETSPNLDVRVAASYRHQYIALPVKAGFRYGRNLYGFASVAIVPALLTKASGQLAAFELYDKTRYPEQALKVYGTRSFDLGAMAELGGGYNFSKRYAVYASATYQQSFTPFNTTTQFPTQNHRLLTGSLGLKYALRK